MSPRLRWLVLLLASSLAILAMASVAPAKAPSAHAAGSCGVGAGHGFRYTYLTSLTVKHINCSKGKTVVKHRGGHGWHCTKKRLDTSPVQFDERETCKSGNRQVKWTYTQDT